MKSVVLSVAAVVLASQAHALTAFSVGATGSGDPGGYSPEVAVMTFDGAPAAGVVETDTGPVALYTGTQGVAAAPVGDTSVYEAIQPGGSAKFDFTGYTPGTKSLSVYVGSIDSYNSFSVSTSFATYNFDGTDFLHHDGDQMWTETNRRVFFNLAPGEVLDSITMASSGVAFEYDTMAMGDVTIAEPAGAESLVPTSVTPVPEPASWALMLIGFGGAGALARRRRNIAASAA